MVLLYLRCRLAIFILIATVMSTQIEGWLYKIQVFSATMEPRNHSSYPDILFKTSVRLLLHSSQCSNCQTRIVHLCGPYCSLQGNLIEVNKKFHENALCPSLEIQLHSHLTATLSMYSLTSLPSPFWNLKNLAIQTPRKNSQIHDSKL